MNTNFKFLSNKKKHNEILEPLNAGAGVASVFNKLVYPDVNAMGGEMNVIFIYGRYDYREITSYITDDYEGPIGEFVYRYDMQRLDFEARNSEFILPKIMTINRITIDGFTYGNLNTLSHISDINFNNRDIEVKINYKVYIR